MFDMVLYKLGNRPVLSIIVIIIITVNNCPTYYKPEWPDITELKKKME